MVTKIWIFLNRKLAITFPNGALTVNNSFSFACKYGQWWCANLAQQKTAILNV